MKKNTKVQCDVESCKYNNSKYCGLENLTVSCIGDGNYCHDKKETICRSFSQKSF